MFYFLKDSSSISLTAREMSIIPSWRLEGGSSTGIYSWLSCIRVRGFNQEREEEEAGQWPATASPHPPPFLITIIGHGHCNKGSVCMVEKGLELNQMEEGYVTEVERGGGRDSHFG